MDHECAACKCQLERETTECQKIDGSAPDLPVGWFSRCIDDTNFVLCDVCGAQSHFRGGISPYLRDRLDLMDDARCDLSNEAIALGRERRIMRKRQSPR